MFSFSFGHYYISSCPHSLTVMRNLMNGSLRILKAMLRNSLVSMKVSNIGNRYETEVIYHMLETFKWFSSWLIECYVMLRPRTVWNHQQIICVKADAWICEIWNVAHVLKLIHAYMWDSRCCTCAKADTWLCEIWDVAHVLKLMLIHEYVRFELVHMCYIIHDRVVKWV